MNVTSQATETYTLVIVDATRELVLCNVASGTPQLPSIDVDPSERLALGLCHSLRREAGVESVLLWMDTTMGQRHAIHEILHFPAQLPRQYEMLGIEEAADRLPPPLAETLCTMIDMGRPEFGRFARFGWLSELVKRFGADDLIGFEHWNAGIDFCLIRLVTAKGAFWFKAVGHPNVQEFRNTTTLARLFPKLLPEIVLEIPEWNGWISRHIEGDSLQTARDPRSISEAIIALADLQIDSISSVPELLDMGMERVDARLALGDLVAFFDEMHDAMAAQTSKKSTPLSSPALRVLFETCRVLLQRFADSDMPETLVHGDIGHGNIVMADTPLFLDWCEAWIAHPFIGAEYLFADLHNSSAMFREQEQAFRELYFSRWSSFSTPAESSWARQYAPSYAALTFALVLWRKRNPNIDRRDHWPALRSLVREIDRLISAANGRPQ